MRNISQYPITSDEVMGHLQAVRDEYVASMMIGGTRGMCIHYIEEFLEAHRDELNAFIESKAP